MVDGELNTIADTMSEYQSLDCHKRTINQFILQNSVTGCTMMVNRALRDKMLRITNIDNTIMHDWWAALVAAQFGKTAFIDEPTILYRQQPGSTWDKQALIYCAPCLAEKTDTGEHEAGTASGERICKDI